MLQNKKIFQKDTYKAIYISIIIWGICVFIAFIISMAISLNVLEVKSNIFFLINSARYKI